MNLKSPKPNRNGKYSAKGGFSSKSFKNYKLPPSIVSTLIKAATHSLSKNTMKSYSGYNIPALRPDIVKTVLTGLEQMKNIEKRLSEKSERLAVTPSVLKLIKHELRKKYRVRQRGCSLTYSARTPPAVHPGITITRKNNFLK